MNLTLKIELSCDETNNLIAIENCRRKSQADFRSNL